MGFHGIFNPSCNLLKSHGKTSHFIAPGPSRAGSKATEAPRGSRKCCRMTDTWEAADPGAGEVGETATVEGGGLGTLLLALQKRLS
jgi:hypothetical protein